MLWEVGQKEVVCKVIGRVEVMEVIDLFFDEGELMVAEHELIVFGQCKEVVMFDDGVANGFIESDGRDGRKVLEEGVMGNWLGLLI